MGVSWNKPNGSTYADWKLVVKKGVSHLYDLKKDIHEDNDIAAQHPNIVNCMVDIIYQEYGPNELFNVTLLQKIII